MNVNAVEVSLHTYPERETRKLPRFGLSIRKQPNTVKLKHRCIRAFSTRSYPAPPSANTLLYDLSRKLIWP